MDLEELAYILEAQGWAPVLTNGNRDLAGVQLQHRDTCCSLVMELEDMPGYQAYLANFVRVFTGSCAAYGPGKYLGLRVAAIYEQLAFTNLDQNRELGTLLTTGIHGLPDAQYVNDFYHVAYTRTDIEAVSRLYQIPTVHLVGTPVATSIDRTLHHPKQRWLLFALGDDSQLKVSGWVSNSEIIHFMNGDDFVLNPHLESW